MNLAGMKILPVVTAKSGENPDHRKGKGFSATLVSRELVDPNQARNPKPGKGKPVNIPVLQQYPSATKAYVLTSPDRPSRTVVLSNRDSGMEIRKGEKCHKPGWARKGSVDSRDP